MDLMRPVNVRDVPIREVWSRVRQSREWPYARSGLILAAVMIVLAVAILLQSRPPANELVSIEDAMAHSAPPRAAWTEPTEATVARISMPDAAPLKDAKAKPPPRSQIAALPEPSPVPAPIAVWSGMLASRSSVAGTERADPVVPALVVPALATPRPQQAAPQIAPSAVEQPVVVYDAVRPPARTRARRARPVQYVYVQPRRIAYRRRTETTLGSVSRTVTRNLRTLSRALSSIAD